MRIPLFSLVFMLWTLTVGGLAEFVVGGCIEFWLMLLVIVGCIDDEVSSKSSGENKLFVSSVWLGFIWELDKSFMEGVACKVGLCVSLASGVLGVSCKTWVSLEIKRVNIF